LIDQIDVLRYLYARIIIPQAVLGELQDEGTPGKVKAWVASHPDWLDVRAVSAPLDPVLAFLDVGEREAISFAKELQADALIIDEPDGREMANRAHPNLFRAFLDLHIQSRKSSGSQGG
jgi:uncharacterized protein